MQKKMYSVTKKYKHSKFKPGEAFIKNGKVYTYFFPLNTKRRIKGKKVTVKQNKSGRISVL